MKTFLGASSLCFLSMVHFNSSRNLNLYCPVIAKPLTSQKIIKQRKLVKQIPSKIKNQKQNIEPKVYARERVTKIYNILKYSTWDSAQEQLENIPFKWDSYTVTQVLKTHPPMEKAWLFFNWASGRKNFKHDQYTYTTMLDIFGEARRISSMIYVFKQMKEKGVKIDVVTYTSLMHWMSNDGDVDWAVGLWKEMRAMGCRPTVVSYTAYMKILFDHKRVKEATDVYKEMLVSGLSPNCYTYTVLMEYLASSGKSNEALEIFNKMQEASVQPDKATCNILIKIFCETGETWAMTKILEYMKENFIVLRYPVYQKALETFTTAEESDMLLRQVNRHLSEEHSDGTDSYVALPPNDDFKLENALILYLMNKQNLVAVDSLLSAMMDKGIPLETEVVSKIIEVNCARRRQNGAVLAYEFGMKMGINIDRTAYLALIGVSIATNSYVKVVEIVETMVQGGLSLGTHLNTLLIYRLGCNRQVASAAKVFDLLPDEEKSSAEFTALMGAYFSSGDAEKGLETFKIMKNEGIINMALGTYCVLVDGLEKCGRVGLADYYRKEKKMLTQRGCRSVTIEETICNLVFGRDVTDGIMS